jgi:hypothetical protein
MSTRNDGEAREVPAGRRDDGPDVNSGLAVVVTSLMRWGKPGIRLAWPHDP